MKRTGQVGLSLLLLFVLAAALPSFGQDKPKQAKTTAEYNAYIAFYQEKDPAKKAALGEKFIQDFKESDYVPDAHMGIIGGYSNAKNWTKVTEAAENALKFPAADNKLKAYANFNAMVASQNSNDIDKAISYGEKVLAIQPDDVNTMITVSALIPSKLSSDEATKKGQLDKAEKYATTALTTVEGMNGKADAATKAQLIPIEGTLHATLGLIAVNRKDYQKSIQEYLKALEKTPKDDVARFYLASDYQALGAQASDEYKAALKAENDAKTAKAEQPVIDELAAKRGGLEDDIRKYRDMAIDEYAKAVAINGPVAAQAKEVLTKLWTNKNDNTNGLEDHINKMKAELK
jgi:tetratricopeptide (TPR) repeat protein